MADQPMDIDPPVSPVDKMDYNMTKTFSPLGKGNGKGEQMKQTARLGVTGYGLDYEADDEDAKTEEHYKTVVKGKREEKTQATSLRFSNDEMEFIMSTAAIGGESSKAKTEDPTGTASSAPKAQRQPRRPREPRRARSPTIMELNQMLQSSRDPMPPKQMLEESGNCRDMIGVADYMYLGYEKVQEHVAGKYVIIYSRPLVVDQSGDLKEVIHEANSRQKGRVIKIQTSKLPEIKQTTQSREMEKVLDKGYWGAGFLFYNGHKAILKLGGMRGDHEANVAVVNKEPFDKSIHKDTRLDKIMDIGFQEEGLVTFGVKYVTSHEQCHYGFSFVRLVLDCFDPETGEDSSELIVGVKVPDLEDVSSAFLLSQPINWCGQKYHERVWLEPIYKKQPIKLTSQKRKLPPTNARPSQRRDSNAGKYGN